MTVQLRSGAMSVACRELGLSREALAQRMGVSASTLFRIDRGDSTPSNRVIGLLLLTTQRSFEEMFEVVDSGPPTRGTGA